MLIREAAERNETLMRDLIQKQDNERLLHEEQITKMKDDLARMRAEI